MTRSQRAEYAEAIREIADQNIATYLSAHSNLPGPRANLTLLDAAGDALPKGIALALVEDADEYLASCGTVALGRLMLEGDPGAARLLTRQAGDDRWRVREAAAIAAQHIGDEDPARLRELVAAWVAAQNPLIVRAGIAAICEPRLLADAVTATAALTACRIATDHLIATSPAHRKDAGVRTLRQALGYCWSVAVAADPGQGVPAFQALAEGPDAGDPDVVWVYRENLKKKRLAALV